MTDVRSSGEQIVLVTNVGPTILRAYFQPLAQLEEVAGLTIVRDREFVPFAGNVEWQPSGVVFRNRVIRIAGRFVRVVALLLRRKPDSLMVMHWFPDGLYLYPLARSLGLPLTAHIIGGTAEIDGGARKLALSRAPQMVKRAAQALTRRMLNRVAAVTFTGSGTLERFRSRGVNAPRLFVVRPLVPSDAHVLGLSERSVDIVYVGRIDADKRFDRFLRILVAVGARRSSVTVRVCGVTSEEVARDRGTRQIGLPGSVRVQYLGRIPDVRPQLRTGKVFVLTSDSEGLSLAMLEAMGCGTVPVVTEVGDIGATVNDAHAGIAIPLCTDEAANVRAMADAVDGLLDDELRWARHSSAAHFYIRDRHSLAGTQSDWRKILKARVGATRSND